MSEIDDLSFLLRKLEKKEEVKAKLSRRKKIRKKRKQ